MSAKRKTQAAAKSTRSHRTDQSSDRQPRDRVQLDRERIVAVALGLVDREGLKALSMRRLGAELGVDPMAVYYYLPGKQALFDAIVEAVMGAIDLSIDDPAAPAEERVLAAARAYCGVLLAHPNALPILLAHGPATEVALRPVELLVQILRDAGLPLREALAGMNLIAAAVRGAVGMGVPQEAAHDHFEKAMRTVNPEQFPNLSNTIAGAGMSFDETFNFGIRAVARGLLSVTREIRPTV